MRKVLVLGLSALVALSTVFACSSTTTTNPAAPEEGGAKEGGSDGGKDKDSSTAPPEDSGTTTNPDQACADEATLIDCATCCGPTNHASGYKLFVDSVTECACAGTGSDAGTAPCATDCAQSFCKTPPAQANATCNTCLQTSIQNGECAEHVSTKCSASPDCLAQQACVAKCQGKP